MANMKSSTLDAFEVIISRIQMRESLAKASDEILVMSLASNLSSTYIQMNHIIWVCDGERRVGIGDRSRSIGSTWECTNEWMSMQQKIKEKH